MNIDELVSAVNEALDDLKAENRVALDVTSMSEVMDTLVIAGGTSSRHVKSLANHVVEELKKRDVAPIGVEGMEAADWVLVDYGSIVVHIMLPQARKFYDLEKLWTPMELTDTLGADSVSSSQNSDVN